MSNNNIRGIDLHDSLKLVNPKPVDVWSGPYESVEMANNSIPIAIRYISMIVRIINNNGVFLYWYKDGIENACLVQYLYEDFEKINNKHNELSTELNNNYIELNNKYSNLNDDYNVLRSGVLHPNLTAIEVLSDNSGFLKKIDANKWGLDTNTYLLSKDNAVSATVLETPRAFSITGGATARAVNFDGSNTVTLNVTEVDASKLTKTIPSEVLGTSTLHIGTTPIKLNRPGGELTLSGITSIELSSTKVAKPIIKYSELNNAIYLEKTDGTALNLHINGEVNNSNRLDSWDDYDSSKANWGLSAKLGNYLNEKMPIMVILSEQEYDDIINKDPHTYYLIKET